MKAMLNWYRASPLVVPEPGETVVDSRRSWTCRPRCLQSACRIWSSGARTTGRCCRRAWPGWTQFAPDLTIRRLAGCGHWLLHEKPAEVAAEIRSFLAR